MTTSQLGRARRRIGLVIGSAVATLSLVACGGVETNDGDQPSGEGITLEIVGNTNGQDATEALVEAYEAENPNVNFTTSYAPVDQLQTALRTRLGAGNAPDLFAAWPGDGSSMATVPLAQAGLAAPISDQDWLTRVPESLRPLLGYEGESYLWSAGVGIIGTIYNERVFEENNVAIPETWSELLDTCTQFESLGIAPMALGNQTPWITQLISYAIATTVAFGEEPELAEMMLTGERTFSNSGWRETLERYMLLEETGCFNDNVNGTTVEQAISMLADGDAAMMVTVSPHYGQVLDASEGRATFGMFPFPAAEDPDDLVIPAGIAQGFMASPTSDHLDIAKDFLAFIGQQEQSEAFAEAGDLIPFGSEDPAELDPILQPFAQLINDDRAMPYPDQQWPNAEVQPTHFAVIQQLFAGTTSIDQALQTLDDAYND